MSATVTPTATSSRSRATSTTTVTSSQNTIKKKFEPPIEAEAFHISTLPSPNLSSNTNKEHHTPTGFRNPWPSFKPITAKALFQARFGNHPERNFVPVPEGQDGLRSDELVRIQTPDWGVTEGAGGVEERSSKLRATWIGHASFYVEIPVTAPSITTSSAATTSTTEEQSTTKQPSSDSPSDGQPRGIRILFDPVWSERTSPATFIGPKRYSPVPCPLSEVPEVDIICISHNHYDHLDRTTIQELFTRRGGKVMFVVPLGDATWFENTIGVPRDQVVELDWWDRRRIEVRDVGGRAVEITCIPSQHGSRRTPFNTDRSLWCGWVLDSGGKKLYFAGDTGYQAVDTPSPCPAFAELGEAMGPFDLAMLPIGLCTPASVMGGVHATPEQSLEIHRQVRSRLSVGMHYGTVRGGISAYFEDVRDPPRRWREVAEKHGVWNGGGVEGKGERVGTDLERSGVGLLDIGETVAV